MEIAIIGLGKMGSALAMNGVEKNLTIHGLTRGEVPAELLQIGVIPSNDLSELVSRLKAPRKIFLYIPAGKAIEEYVLKLADLLDEGDVLIDGGNSYWGDSLRRSQTLEQKGILFIDMGTSGGISGARKGACFMAGGDIRAYSLIEPVLKLLAVPEGYAYVGPSGSGHLVKLIHNGIEFGMLQAIGEGMALLTQFKKKIDIDIDESLKVYQHGSVIRSWLIELLAQQYHEQKSQTDVVPYIEDTGEVNWLLNDALHLEVPIPVISQSIMELFRSRDKNRFDYSSIAMMRHGFGGHPFGADENLQSERKTGRINDSFQLQ